ncbi:MAG TPA: hypothetical protein VKB87_18955 [Myxococcaceae bacterium]|nr:hypothetical protein [Myxococcaceae bacterium]
MRSRKWMYMFVLGVLQMGIAIGCGGGSSDSNGSMSGGSQTGSSFSQNVQPIFNARCTAGCHSGSSPQGGLDLSAGVSYANLVNKAVSLDCAASSPGAVRVNPGDPQGSMLWRKLANTGDKCLSAMPLGTSGLINVARSDFDSIEKWIQEGALNN